MTTIQNQKPWYRQTVADCAAELKVNIQQGLSAQEVQRRLQQFGSNHITEVKIRPWWRILFNQFKDVMILVLLAAALVSGVIGDLVDTITILVIVILNAVIGMVQEMRAEQAMAALRELATPETHVLRDGEWVLISSLELVPGDVVQLEAGSIIPADLRMTKGSDVEVDESSLTGESVGVAKQIGVLEAPEVAIADQKNMLFKGTQINRGSVIGLVVATGMETELGKIAHLIEEAEVSLTPLQKRMVIFSKRLALVVLLICGLVFALGVLRGEPWLLMLLTGISLAVAAIPEALPAVVNVSLALGAKKMSHLNALMRNLPAVETLGSVTYICTDKTGTLTQNQMHVTELWMVGSDQNELFQLSSLPMMGKALALSNDVIDKNHNDGEDKGKGEPTELALFMAAVDAGFKKVELEQEWPRTREVAFHSDRKRMTTVHYRQHNHTIISFTKGAPESVLPLCQQAIAVDGENVAFDVMEWERKSAELASSGYRVLALAMREWPNNEGQKDLPSVTDEELESKLTFLGIVAMIDPPREDAKTAIDECQSAGITPVMITGDHPATALAIAKQLGMATDGGVNGGVISGMQMAKMSDEELFDTVKKVRVYARVSPEQKVKLVHALKAQGEFCSMTGDGVNDAPALKNAHIGVAMGLKGTDVAREASDMVLLDDRFSTIVAAVKEGRRVFDNIRKFINYTMTSNSGEIWVLLLAPFLGMPISLLPIHILWINLVTDGLPGLALAMEPSEDNLMERQPRPPNESIFAHGMWQHIILIGLLIGGVSLYAQYWALENSPEHWQTMVFTTLTFAQLIHVLVIRSERQSLWRLGLFSNRTLIVALIFTVVLQIGVTYLPLGNMIFKTTPLPVFELSVCLALSSLIFFAVEIEKALVRMGWIYKK